jgi:hypothetical protein
VPDIAKTQPNHVCCFTVRTFNSCHPACQLPPGHSQLLLMVLLRGQQDCKQTAATAKHDNSLLMIL